MKLAELEEGTGNFTLRSSKGRHKGRKFSLSLINPLTPKLV
jgi:hypothetical protein